MMRHGEKASPRHPAVAGTFYPADPGELGRMIESLLAEAEATCAVPGALIAPHAGYIYSGPIAASAYSLLPSAARRIQRIALLGPSHLLPFRGFALSGSEAFETPLGIIPLDREAGATLEDLAQVRTLDAAHAQEHSLEVHLPFLQTVLESFTLVPVVVGQATPAEVAEVVEHLWRDDSTLVVVSSDLSHYHDYEAARHLDDDTSAAIERLDPDFIDPEHACGCRGVNGLLLVARRRGLTARVLDQRNSGDTAGDRHRVVGYGAYAFH